MPIFREAPPDVLSNREFHVAISAQPSIPKEFLITGLIHSPGLVHSQTWHLIDEDKWARLGREQLKPSRKYLHQYLRNRATRELQPHVGCERDQRFAPALKLARIGICR
jgi:hypothetical protein